MFGDKKSFGFSASDSANFDKMVSDPYNFSEIEVVAYCSSDSDACLAFAKDVKRAGATGVKSVPVTVHNIVSMDGASMNPNWIRLNVAWNPKQPTTMYILCARLFDISEKYGTPKELWNKYYELMKNK